MLQSDDPTISCPLPFFFSNNINQKSDARYMSAYGALLV
jgi:hypothetical protein